MNRRTAEKIFEGVDYNNREEITEFYNELKEVFTKRLEGENSEKEKKRIIKHLKILGAAYRLLINEKLPTHLKILKAVKKIFVDEKAPPPEAAEIQKAEEFFKGVDLSNLDALFKKYKEIEEKILKELENTHSETKKDLLIKVHNSLKEAYFLMIKVKIPKPKKMDRKLAEIIFKGIDFANGEEITKKYKEMEPLLNYEENKPSDKKSKFSWRHRDSVQNFIENAYILLIQEQRPRVYTLKYKLINEYPMILVKVLFAIVVLVRMLNECSSANSSF